MIIRQSDHVTRIDEREMDTEFLVGKPEGKKPYGRP
jgi:hypothetical protein